MGVARVLKAGLAAGVVAGVVLALYVVLVMQPLIAEAESYETNGDPPVVSDLLTDVTAVLGAVVVGVMVAIPFALVFPFIRHEAPWRGHYTKAWAYGGLAFVIFNLLPLLAVPTAPPGVERLPEVETRIFWFVGTMVAGVGGVVAALAVYRLGISRATTEAGRGTVLVLSLLVVQAVWALPFLLGPETVIRRGPVPASLITAFAFLTFLEWILFWAVLSTGLAFFWRRFEPREAPLPGELAT